MARRRKTIQGILSGIVIALALLGTLFVVVTREPEMRQASSSDGRLTVQGKTSANSVVSVDVRASPGPFTAVVGPVYDIHATNIPASGSWTLTFAYDPAWFGSEASPNPVVYRFDTSREAWSVQPSVVDRLNHTLAVDVTPDPTGTWAVGVHLDSTVPENVQAAEAQLIAAPPTGMVGYQTFVAVSTEANDFVLLPGLVERGGCDGAYQDGQRRTMTSQDVTWGRFTYRVGVLWQIADGCDVVAP